MAKIDAAAIAEKVLSPPSIQICEMVCPAKINGVKITQAQVRTAYEQAKKRLMLSMGSNYSYDQKFQDKINFKNLFS